MSAWWWIGIALVGLIVVAAIVYFIMRAIIEVGERDDFWHEVEVPTAEIPRRAGDVGLGCVSADVSAAIARSVAKSPVLPKKPTAHGKRRRNAKASKPKKPARKSRKASK